MVARALMRFNESDQRSETRSDLLVWSVALGAPGWHLSSQAIGRNQAAHHRVGSVARSVHLDDHDLMVPGKATARRSGGRGPDQTPPVSLRQPDDITLRTSKQPNYVKDDRRLRRRQAEGLGPDAAEHRAERT